MRRLSTMQISTHKEAIQYTIRQAFVATSLAVMMMVVGSVIQFGTDLDATVRVGYVIASNFFAVLAITPVLTGFLAYGATLLMKELTLTRAELFRLSRTDQLTGLLNRRGFDEAAISELKKAHVSTLPVVAMMCDIDHFKSINDRYGHEFGDIVLASISESLRIFASDNGLLVARYGGEEFVIFAVGISSDEAMIYAEAMRQGCSNRQIISESHSVHVTVSIGTAWAPTTTNLADLLRTADEALYSAKRRGRNCVVRTDALAAA